MIVRFSRAKLLAIIASAFGSVVAATVARAGVNPVLVQPAHIQGLPDLTVNARTPTYTLNSNCSTGGGAITFHLNVSNNGIASSAAIAQQFGGVMISTAMQTNGPGYLWSVAVALPSIPAHATLPIEVTLMPLSPPSAMAGTHVFSVAVNVLGHVKTLSQTDNTTNITVNVPKGFCPNYVSSQVGIVPKLASPVPVVGPGQTLESHGAQNQPSRVLGNGSGGSQSTSKYSKLMANSKVMLAPTVNAPTNLTYTNDPTVCQSHAPGLASALICPSLIASASTLPLVWSWHQCTTIQGSLWLNTQTTTECGTVSQPDGFHIYKVTGFVYGGSRFSTVRLPTRTLVDTQSDPTITIRGISPFNKTDCYVVTAFKGSTESADSNQWCGAPDLAMGTATLTLGNGFTTYGNSYLSPSCAPWSNELGLHEAGVFTYVGLEKESKDSSNYLSCDGDIVSDSYYVFPIPAYINKIKSMEFDAAFGPYCPWNVSPCTSSPSSPSDRVCWATGVVETNVDGSGKPTLSNNSAFSSEFELDNGMLRADITKWFLTGVPSTVALTFLLPPDPTEGQSFDTCLTQIRSEELIIQYYPQSGS